jgi:MoaA/NifB/PqqE/SkfB family radical SAM enzyme
MRRADGIYRRLYEAASYRLRTLAGGRLAGWCRPASIVILTTELCNARCVHCDMWKNSGKEDSPAAEQWKRVLSDLRAWLGPVQVCFSGGEALLRPFTTELVEYASQIGLFVEVLTHGYWKDQTVIERLALAKPWRVTVSLDGLGETHSKIRGREGFFEVASRSIETLRRVRKEHRLDYAIRLKTVLMEHNLQEAAAIARFATRGGMEVFYQAVEQNYNTAEDPRWFESSPNWPKDPERAAAAVVELIQLKQSGLHVANSRAQLEVMLPYFRTPDALRVAIQSHSAHERRQPCAALTMLQFQANGDVRVCASKDPVGNIKTTRIRKLWEERPRYWEAGCCLERRRTEAEKRAVAVRGAAK